MTKIQCTLKVSKYKTARTELDLKGAFTKANVERALDEAPSFWRNNRDRIKIELIKEPK